jgi:hypothetical protein
VVAVSFARDGVHEAREERAEREDDGVEVGHGAATERPSKGVAGRGSRLDSSRIPRDVSPLDERF